MLWVVKSQELQSKKKWVNYVTARGASWMWSLYVNKRKKRKHSICPNNPNMDILHIVRPWSILVPVSHAVVVAKKS